MNNIKTGMLLIVLTALLVFVGILVDQAFHTRYFMFVFFIFSVGMNLVNYWYSDKIVLKLHGAQPVSPAEMPELHDIVGRLALQAGIPKPAVYIVPTDIPNAFATGRSPRHAAVAVTQGILNTLDWRELEGVLAHELAHIRNRDTLISTVAAIIAGLIMLLSGIARWGLFFAMGSRDRDSGGSAFAALAVAIFAPIAALIIQMAISRAREFKADEQGARISHKPLALADALVRIENAVSRYRYQGTPTMSHLYIINPLRGRSLRSLFSTHPSTQERVKRLQELAKQMGVYA
ncbi:zinc metalloprotease HtpX [Candidatus Sumerlaeota bacterium]|nr:zinc metalloprotease HtpX [Candidatus Sumerlaeota bacterium]